jgi:hypothetical protein
MNASSPGWTTHTISGIPAMIPSMPMALTWACSGIHRLNTKAAEHAAHRIGRDDQPNRDRSTADGG